jgi:hypothetical protein
MWCVGPPTPSVKLREKYCSAPKEKTRREVSLYRREVGEYHECFESEARASSAQDQTPSINPGQEMCNSSRAWRLGHIATRQLALRTSVSSISVTVIRPGAGCSITSAATVSTTAATGCFTFRAAFFTGPGLGLALATARFAVLATLRALLRLAEFALRSLARLCTFDPFLRLAMIDPPFWLMLRNALTLDHRVPATYQTSYQQIAA